MYLFFSCISPNPNLGYTMPPTPGMIPFSLSLRVSIANVKKLNLSDMEAGNSFFKLAWASYTSRELQYKSLGDKYH